MEFLSSFLPEQASTIAARVDLLFLGLLAFSGLMCLLIFSLGVYFAWKFRAGSPAPRRKVPSSRVVMETSWILIAFLISIGFFWWASAVYMDIVRGPSGPTLDITVSAKQWMWKFEHPSGKREINVLHLPRGQRVKLVMNSIDVIHSFFVPAFRLKHDVVPGATSTLSFIPDKNGEYHLFCAEYCGTGHSRMRGEVVVMDPAEYALWAGLPPEDSMAAQGERLARKFACYNCHMDPNQKIGPYWVNLYGRTERLTDGRTVIVNEDYIRQMVLNPESQRVAGYDYDMPTFKGRISDEEIDRIIAYIKSLAPGTQSQGAGNGTQPR